MKQRSTRPARNNHVLSLASRAILYTAALSAPLAFAQSAAQPMQGMDHSDMKGMDHSQMPGMGHGDMKGMDHSQMKGMVNRTLFGGRHEATMSVIHGRPVRSLATNRQPAGDG